MKFCFQLAEKFLCTLLPTVTAVPGNFSTQEEWEYADNTGARVSSQVCYTKQWFLSLMLQFAESEKKYCHLCYRLSKYLDHIRGVADKPTSSLLLIRFPCCQEFPRLFWQQKLLGFRPSYLHLFCKAVSWVEICLVILACFLAGVALWTSGGTAGAETCMLGTCSSVSWAGNRAQESFEVGTTARSWPSLRKQLQSICWRNNLSS